MEREGNVTYLDRKRAPIKVYMPWHKGWLGAIPIVNGTTEFTLDSKELKAFIQSQRNLGIKVVVHQMRRGETIPK